jgi:methyl coenzyme M reductase alpha subunit
MESFLIALWSALAMGASFICLGALIARRGATALNLRLEIHMEAVANVTTNQKPAFRIAPTAGGKALPLTSLTDIVYAISDGNVADPVVSDDRSSVELHPIAAGTVTLTVTAKNSAGVEITDSVVVTFVDPPADALNLQRTDA